MDTTQYPKKIGVIVSLKTELDETFCTREKAEGIGFEVYVEFIEIGTIEIEFLPYDPDERKEWRVREKGNPDDCPQ